MNNSDFATFCENSKWFFARSGKSGNSWTVWIFRIVDRHQFRDGAIRKLRNATIPKIYEPPTICPRSGSGRIVKLSFCSFLSESPHKKKTASAATPGGLLKKVFCVNFQATQILYHSHSHRKRRTKTDFFLYRLKCPVLSSRINSEVYFNIFQHHSFSEQKKSRHTATPSRG